jgi:hypothetical protein
MRSGKAEFNAETYGQNAGSRERVSQVTHAPSAGGESVSHVIGTTHGRPALVVPHSGVIPPTPTAHRP